MLILSLNVEIKTRREHGRNSIFPYSFERSCFFYMLSLFDIIKASQIPIFKVINARTLDQEKEEKYIIIKIYNTTSGTLGEMQCF